MDPYGRFNNYWDIAQQPAQFSTLADDDFLALLQKQFPTIGVDPKPDGVDPQSLSNFTIPHTNTSPSSSDSSPSPPSGSNEPPSRPQSGVFNSPITEQSPDERLKRKASEDDMDEDPPHKSANTNASGSNKKLSSSSRRKSTGNPQHDEFRLLKRKEQNRAAQRAFRERKEKHVKDLEDKVAALEAKNAAAESENDNLRDLLQRLQSENMALKQGNFTFQMSKDGSSFTNTPTPADVNANFGSPVASSSKPPAAQNELNFGQLIPFDLSVMDENPPQGTATDTAMNMDYGFNGSTVHGNGNFPYRTLASNPEYMSFAEPMSFDTPDQQSTNHTPGGLETMGMTPFDTWSPPHSSESSLQSHSMDSFDQLFGGNYMASQSPVDFNALLRSPPSSISPVSHASLRSNSQSSISASNSPAGSAPASMSSSSSPSVGTSGNPSTPVSSTNQHTDCPKTKEDLRQLVEQQGGSAFVEQSNPTSPASFLRKSCDTGGPMIMCVKGSSFPKTEKSEKNIEVLTAWRSITSDPQFKDIDINELCSEFTSKARCDGTKVVLEPEGVHHIIETLAARKQQK
ncbi:bZIP YAP Transcription Factor [Abortiporus biennis]